MEPRPPSTTRPTILPRPLPRSFWLLLPVLLLPYAVLIWVFIRLGMALLIVPYGLLGVVAVVGARQSQQVSGLPSGRAVATFGITDQAVVVHVLFPGPLRHRKDVVIPLGAITSVRSDAEASRQPPGVSRSVSGVANRRYSVGVFWPPTGKPWRAVYAVRRGMPSVVVDLHSDDFQRVIFEATDPEPIAAAIRDAVARWKSRDQDAGPPRARVVRHRRSGPD